MVDIALWSRLQSQQVRIVIVGAGSFLRWSERQLPTDVASQLISARYFSPLTVKIRRFWSITKQRFHPPWHGSDALISYPVDSSCFVEIGELDETSSVDLRKEPGYPMSAVAEENLVVVEETS